MNCQTCAEFVNKTLSDLYRLESSLVFCGETQKFANEHNIGITPFGKLIQNIESRITNFKIHYAQPTGIYAPLMAAEQSYGVFDNAIIRTLCGNELFCTIELHRVHNSITRLQSYKSGTIMRYCPQYAEQHNLLEHKKYISDSMFLRATNTNRDFTLWQFAGGPLPKNVLKWAQHNKSLLEQMITFDKNGICTSIDARIKYSYCCDILINKQIKFEDAYRIFGDDLMTALY